MEKQFEKGYIRHDGMGGFLNPPTHPEHSTSVTGKDFSMSLSSAVDSEWLDPAVRDRAKQILDSWTPPPIDSEPIKDWIRHCLGYFQNCYSPDGINRKVDDCLIWIPADKKPDGRWQHFERDNNRHLGVMFIRKYYPEYIPTDEDFENAYWGKKAGD